MHTAVDWGERYRIDHTPWDLGAAHPALIAAIESGELQPPHEGARAFVPGCGRAHDAFALARAGWRVTAADLVEDLRPVIEPELAPFGGDFISGDSLAIETEEPYDLFWEHTFFCAIHPDRRADYGTLARRILAPNARLVALIFPIGRPDDRGGPPWRVDNKLYESAIGDGFERESLGPLTPRVQGREWSEQLAVYRRKA